MEFLSFSLWDEKETDRGAVGQLVTRTSSVPDAVARARQMNGCCRGPFGRLMARNSAAPSAERTKNSKVSRSRRMIERSVQGRTENCTVP